METGKTFLEKRAIRRTFYLAMLLLIFSPNFGYTLTDPDVDANDFTIVIVPDSQLLVQNSPTNNELWKHQLQWVVDNKNTLNIKFLMHVGDMVHHTNPDSDNPNNPGIDQWYWAQRATAVLDGNVPWFPGVGNHEFWDGDTWHYNQAYPYTEFTGLDYFMGHYPSTKNDSHYGVFTAGGIDFLCLSMRDCAKVPMTSAEWTWANNVISNNPDKLVIYVTHNYLSKGLNDVGGQSIRSAIGDQHWNNVVSNYSNIMMVHCGHLGTLGTYAYRRVDYISGKPCHQIIQDYQGDTNSNWVRYYILKPDSNEIICKTYSPIDQQYLTESNQQFTLSYPFPQITEYVNITNPPADSTVAGDVNITVDASDSDGIDRVKFYIDGVYQAEDTTSPYSWTWDTTGETDSTHEIKVDAVDDLSNSNIKTINVTVDNTSSVLTFNPTDDSFCNESNPTANYGTATYVKVRDSSAGYGRLPFLKFTVSGVPQAANITSVKLKMYSQDVTQSIAAKAVSDTSWTEGAITWNNKPTVGSTLDTNTPSASSWVAFDVNSHVTGNGTYSFCLQASTDTPQQFDSKENTHDPILEVTYQLDTTPPAAPNGLSATAGDTEIFLKWNSNTESDFSHYSVWRDTSSGGPYTEIASNVDSNDYNDFGLTNGTTYYYVVTAFDTYDNESNDSNEASAAPQNLNPPAAPTGLTATPGNGQVELDWNDNTEPDFNDYSVWRSTTSGGSYTEVASGLTTSAYTNTGLTNGTTYYYVVTAYDTADNNSVYSSEVSAKPQSGGTVQVNPTDDALVNHNLPDINYGSAGYLAVRSDATGKARNSFLKFTVSGVAGTVTAAKLKMYSTDVTQTVYAKAVANTSWTEGSITWNNQPSAGATLDTKAPGATSWVEFDVTSHVTGNGTYSFCLQGSIDGGQTFESSEATNIPVLEVSYGDDTTPPSAPTGLTATAGDTQVTLDWNDNTEPDLWYYNLYRDTSSGGPYDLVDSNITTSEYTDTNLSNGTTYYYVVTAVDVSENESNDSNEASATPAGILSFNPTDDALVNHNLPDNNYGSATYMAVRSDSTSLGRNSFLKFTVSNVSGTVTSAKLKVYSQTVTMSVDAKAVANTSWVEETITWNNQPSAGSTLDTKSPGTAAWVEFDVSGSVTGNGTYSFRLSGNVDTGQVFDTKEATNKPVLIVSYGPDITAPAAPTGLTATAGDAQVSLDWDDNSEPDISHYHVSRSTTQGGSYSEIASNVTVSNYTDSYLTNGTTYYYVVNAVDEWDNESNDSNEASATPQAGGTLEFNPTDDATVIHSVPTGNYGDYTFLKVRNDDTGKARNTFLKFTVSGVTGTVTAAKLKMYSIDITQSVPAKAVSDTSWTEGTITWNNQPTIGSTLDTKTPSAASWVEFDVTSHIAGNGTYSICLQGTEDTGDDFESSEANNIPILEVTYGGGGDSNAPAAPTGLFRKARDTEVTLDWDDSNAPDFAYYNVYRDTSSGTPYTKVGSNVKKSVYTDTGLTNNTTYYYVVTAVDSSANESSNSIEVSATPKAYQYARPSSDKSNTGGYTTTPLYAKVDEVTRSDSDYLKSPLITDPDVDYYCELNLSSVSDPGAYSGDEDHILSYAFRAAISPATENGPQSFVVLLYQGSTKINNYNERKCGHQTTWTQRDRRLLPEEIALITDYSALYVKIRTNAQGTSGENAALSWVQLKVPAAKETAPTAPSGFSASTVSDKYIDLSWTDNSSNEDGFIVERKLTTGGTWERLYPKVAPNVTSYRARVAPSTNYTFRVCAYNSGGESSYSGTDSATSSSHTPGSYYVSTTGNDLNSGALNAPFLTIQKGVDMLSAGDTLYIRSGTYHEQVELACLTGTDANRITITNYPNDTNEVILDGTEEITSTWDVHSGNIYKTTLSKDIWQLFVSGEMMTPARWPNADNPMATNSNHWNRDSTWGLVDNTQSTADHTYHTGTPSLSGTGKSFEGGIAILNTGGWTTFAEEITSHTSGNNHFTHHYTDNYNRFSSDMHYYIEGDLDCLDAAEEWYYDPSTKVLYLYASGGVDPDTIESIRGKVWTYAMELDYCEYLTIQGIKFYGNALCSDEGRQLIIDGCTFTYPSFRPTMLGIDSEYMIEHEEDEYYCYPYFKGQTYIWNTNNDVNTQNVVKNCTFQYTDGAGLDMTRGKEDVMENNYFEYIDFSGLGQTSTNLQLNPDSVYRRNTIHTTSTSETFRLGKRGLAEYNHAWNTGNLQNDGSIFQLRWENQNGAIVRYNWGHDTIKIGNRFDGPQAGIGNDHGLTHHNVFMGCDDSGIVMKGDYHETYSNTCLDSGSQNDIVIKYLSNDGLSYENQNSITKNNACYKLEGDKSGDVNVPGTLSNNWVGYDLNPTEAITTQLRDPANFDFRPKSGSDLVDAGAVISGITDGYLGNGPDIGAYEYNCTSYWIPGCKFEKASTPVPPDGATGVKRACDPAWLEALDATNYNIYFGTSSPGTFIQNQSSNLYDRTSDLSATTTYYWRIDANTPSGIVTGDVWSFTTGSN